MAKFEWDKAKQRERNRKKKRKRKQEIVDVHPNSMAAKKWGLAQWRRSV